MGVADECARRAAGGHRRRGRGRRGALVVVQRVLKSRRLRDFALMSVGLVMTAWALDAFLIPNRIAAGGVSGLATVIYYWALANFNVTLPVGVQMLVMNSVLLAIAFRFRGMRYVAKTL